MTSAEARALVDQLDLTEHVAAAAADAPPMPTAAVDVWRHAVANRPTQPEND